uniref:Uncharacterized protein n=1 Tax=Rhizophora mucronata TaxID=61149 RepID=A0A2P2PYN2_RHIMU
MKDNFSCLSILCVCLKLSLHIVVLEMFLCKNDGVIMHGKDPM